MPGGCFEKKTHMKKLKLSTFYMPTNLFNTCHSCHENLTIPSFQIWTEVNIQSSGTDTDLKLG